VPVMPIGVDTTPGTLGNQCIWDRWCDVGLMCQKQWINGHLYTTCLNGEHPSAGELNMPCELDAWGQRTLCDEGLICQGVGTLILPVCVNAGPIRPPPVGSSSGVYRRLDFAL